MTKFYVDDQGKFLGAYDGADPPQGAIEVDAPPDDGRKLLVNGQWVWPPQIAAVLYRRARAVAYRDEMGAEQGDFLLTIGDVLDGILGQFEFMAANGVALTPEMQEMLDTRAQIKVRIPKP